MKHCDYGCAVNPPTHQHRPDTTQPTGLGWFLGLGGLGWVTKIFFIYWVGVIKLQTRQTRPDPPIINIYLKYIIYLMIF